MGKVYNRKDMQARRRQLRKRATPQEKRLYEALRRRQVAGVRFRFNSSIGHYAPDFYCPSQRLVVELDGSQHDSEEIRGYDEARTAYFNALGIRVLRFKNAEIDEDMDAVIRTISEAIAGR